MPQLISVPNPLPAPIAGGGPQDGYQFRFNTRYYQTRKQKLQKFFYGRPGAQPGAELTQQQRDNWADKLWRKHVDFDEEVDYEGMEPYSTMYQREVVFGYQRVLVGTGTFTPNPPPVVNPADLQGPPIAGKYLLVTCDINKL